LTPDLRCAEQGERSAAQVRRIVKSIEEKLIPAAGAACGWTPPAASLQGLRKRSRRRR
jgi:hypothetical protein